MTATNPLGAVVVFDGENPRSFTGKAQEDILAGELVCCSGAFDNVSSGASSFSTGDLVICKVVAATSVNGIALNPATSGNIVSVATRGGFLIRATGSVLQGTLVEAIDEKGVQSLSSGAVPSSLYGGIMAGKIIGRAMTAAGSPNFALIDLHI